MSRRHVIANCLFFLLFAMPNAAAPARSNEPFTSFRIIDKQLSLINGRSAALKPTNPRQGRMRDIREIGTALRRIRQRSRRLNALYQARHERFGAKVFRALDDKAGAASRALTSAQHARSDADSERAFGQFNKATIDLVLEFQAVSANYGANHCAARQWACCEPRKDPETNRGPAEGCQWTCVAKTRACTGFLGPQTPRGAPGPR